MRKIIMICTVALLAGGFMASQAQTAKNKTNDAKVKALEKRKAALQRQIKEEDGKRNAPYPGVSIETLETLHDRQDSLCLSLRSELTDIELEIQENTEFEAPPQLMEKYKELNQGK